MKARTLIFDVGRVLVGFDWEAYLHRFGYGPQAEEAIARAMFAGPYWQEFDRGEWPEKRLLDAFSSLAPAYREEISQVFSHVEGCISRLSYARPWLKELRGRGYRLYYLSNYSQLMLERTRDCLDFLDLMDGGLFSCEVRLVKPDPAIFRALFERYPQIVPSESVFLDDSAANVRTACSLGLHGILFRSQAQADAELTSLCL